MTDQIYRLSCRRQHRIMGHFFAVHAWRHGLDCVVLDRIDLEHFVGLRRFKSIRVNWLAHDLTPWFPFQVPYYGNKAESSIHSLFLSRVDIKPHLPRGTMTLAERLSKMQAGSPKAAMFRHNAASATPCEAQMIAQLALISCGVSIPQDFDAGSKAPNASDPFEMFEHLFGSLVNPSTP